MSIVRLLEHNNIIRMNGEHPVVVIVFVIFPAAVFVGAYGVQGDYRLYNDVFK